MAHPRRKELRDKDLCGLKYFQVLGPLLDRLHANATQRDHAGNRQLHFDQYAGLILLCFFSPLVDSLRGIQQASSLAKVQKLLGCERAALLAQSAKPAASSIPPCCANSSAPWPSKRCR
jgi:hypothetical protein